MHLSCERQLSELKNEFSPTDEKCRVRLEELRRILKRIPREMIQNSGLFGVDLYPVPDTLVMKLRLVVEVFECITPESVRKTIDWLICVFFLSQRRGEKGNLGGMWY